MGRETPSIKRSRVTCLSLKLNWELIHSCVGFRYRIIRWALRYATTCISWKSIANKPAFYTSL